MIGPGDCSCDTLVDENGLGNCEKDFRGKGAICYVKEPTTCSDIQRTLNGIEKGKKYSWEACKGAKRKKREGNLKITDSKHFIYTRNINVHEIRTENKL